MGVLGGVGGALAGGGVGLVFDAMACFRSLDDMGMAGAFVAMLCPAAAGQRTAAGWVAGAALGGAGLSAWTARGRGCPRTQAYVRAAAGAALGALPGMLAVAGSGGRYPPPRSALVLGTPLLSALGAGAAVVTCQRTTREPHR